MNPIIFTFTLLSGKQKKEGKSTKKSFFSPKMIHGEMEEEKGKVFQLPLSHNNQERWQIMIVCDSQKKKNERKIAKLLFLQTTTIRMIEIFLLFSFSKRNEGVS